MQTIAAAFITGIFTLCVCLINNHTQQKKLCKQIADQHEDTEALLNYKLDELKKRVDKHNNIVERVFILEKQMNKAEGDIKEIRQECYKNENDNQKAFQP